MGVVDKIVKNLSELVPRMEKATTFKEFIKGLESEGKMFYHGTPHGGFDSFSMRKRGTGADAVASFGDWGKGIYMLPEFKGAQRYASGLVKEGVGDSPYVQKVYLTAKNPYNMRDLGERAADVDRQYQDFIRAGRYGKISDAEDKMMYVKAGIDEKEYSFLRDLEGSLGDNWSDIDVAGILKNKGHDALISPNGEVVAFKSSQVKTLPQLHKAFDFVKGAVD